MSIMDAQTLIDALAEAGIETVSNQAVANGFPPKDTAGMYPHASEEAPGYFAIYSANNTITDALKEQLPSPAAPQNITATFNDVAHEGPAALVMNNAPSLGSVG